MNGLVWIGRLFDGRVVLESEPMPADAPINEEGRKWMDAWKCERKDDRLICGAPIGVTCRCVEVLG